MRRFIATRGHSFGNAFRGLSYVLRTQRNAWIHVAISLIVLALSAWLRIDPVEWAIVIVTIAIVFASEFFNTAIEAVVDLASPQKHPLAKVGKDVGAGAVLIAAIAAVFVGLLIFWPRLWERLAPLFRHR